MYRGLYTSALGMTAQMKQMDVVSNNIANVDTTGFKRDNVVTQSFSAELAKRLDDSRGMVPRHEEPVGKMSQGLFVDNVYTDFSAGNLRQTFGTHDMAILDEGFFTISAKDKDGNTVERYTRDGSFVLSSDRTLMTKAGDYVLGENGQIVVPDGTLTVGENGNIYVNNELVDRIRVVNFENRESLRKIGNNLYATTDETVVKPFDSKVLNGYLENSNSDIVREMVNMITVSRAYELNQKMVMTHDTILGSAVTDIARR